MVARTEADLADSDDEAPLMPAFTEAERRALAFAEEVRSLADGVVHAAIAEAVFGDETDGKVFGFALLCRSISNFQGALTMARLDQAVECRTLVRSCIENLFLVDQLLENGDGFAKTMRSNDAAKRISLGERMLKHPGAGESPAGKTLLGVIKSQRAEFPKPSRLTVSDTVEGEMEVVYSSYGLLSHDAAHPSVTALRRHYPQGETGPLAVEIVPPFTPGELLLTLGMACHVILTACVGFSELLGGTSQDGAVRALYERYQRQDWGQDSDGNR
jgi:hypothetical protein